MAKERGVPKNEKGDKITKTDFVLKFPGAPAKDIIAKAKAAGFELTDRYIYSIRSAARARSARGASSPSVGLGPQPAAAGRLAAVPASASTLAEQALFAVAAQLGLGRAIELLQSQQAIAKAILG